MIEIEIMGKQYISVQAASRALGINVHALYRRLNSTDDKWRDWRFLDNKNHAVKKPRVFLVAFLYRLRHKPTGSFYIGSTKDYNGRRATHLWALKNKQHKNTKLQNLWDNSDTDNDWEWDAWIFNKREEAYSEEQKILDENKDSSLLLNMVFDSRSSITDIMKRPNQMKRSIEGSLKWYENLSEDKKEALHKRLHKAAKDYWTEDAKKARMGAGNPFARRMSIDGVEYGSLKSAAKALGITDKTIINRIKSGKFPNYKYLTQPGGKIIES